MFTSQKNNLLKNKEFMLTVGVISICLFLAVLFPAKNLAQGLTKTFFFFLVVPVLYIKFILKKNVRDFGLNFKNRKKGVFWGTLMFFLPLLLFYLGAEHTDFMKHYQLSPIISENFWFFLIYISIFANAFLFFQEFFFRGFLLSFASPYLYSGVAIFQAVVYFLAVILEVRGINEETWQFFPFLILSLTGGITAYKTKSMIYSWISGWVFLIIANSYIIYSIRIK